MSIKKVYVQGIKIFFLILIGSFITAAGINIFLVPNKIAAGGVSGIATVVYYLSNHKFPVGLTMLILNVPLFVFGIKYIGGKFILRTLFGTILLSLIIDGSYSYSIKFIDKYLSVLEGNQMAPDMLLSSIFGGFLMGVGLGLVFKAGATTGGTDMAARIVHHFLPHISIGQILLLIDAVVIIVAATVFKSLLLGLYAIITLFIMSKVIDAIIEGVNFAKSVLIISDKSEEIAKKLLVDMDRGVTALNGTGMYTGDKKQVLMCVLNRSQIPEMKEMVKSIDKDAFVIVNDVKEVLGEGFNSHD